MKRALFHKNTWETHSTVAPPAVPLQLPRKGTSIAAEESKNVSLLYFIHFDPARISVALDLWKETVL